MKIIQMKDEQGGLKVTNVEIQCAAIKLGWIKRITDKTNKASFKIILQKLLPSMNIDDFFSTRCYIDEKIIRKLPLF